MAGGEKYFIPPMALKEDTFRTLMERLSARYYVMALDEAVLKIREGSLPERVIALTFDDGYLDNFYCALDILLQRGLPATFFVPVCQVEGQTAYWWDELYFFMKRSPKDFCLWARGNTPASIQTVVNTWTQKKVAEIEILGRSLVRTINSFSPGARSAFLSEMGKTFGHYEGPRLLMNREELRNLVGKGFFLGSHSSSHVPLTDLDDREVETEIHGSRCKLQEYFGSEIASFCYPRGSWNEDLSRLVEQAGYACAVTTEFGSNMNKPNLFALRRRNISDYQGVRSRFAVRMHLFELTGWLDGLLASRRS